MNITKIHKKYHKHKLMSKINDKVLNKFAEKFPEMDVGIANKIYSEYFATARDVVETGKYPGIVMTNLLSFEFSLPGVRKKAVALTENIIAENIDILKKRFYICRNSTDDEEVLAAARAELSQLIVAYKTRKNYLFKLIEKNKHNTNG